MAKIIISGIIFIIIIIVSIGFIPYQLWRLRLSFLWWLLFFAISIIICISSTQVYPINSMITFRKAIFSFFTGFLFFCLVWSLNSFEQTKISIILLSMMFKAFGGLILGYGIYSLINISF